MSQIVNQPAIPTLSPTAHKGRISVEQLNYLSRLSGLTCFEQEFVARLRGYPDPACIGERELTIFQVIWNRHGRKAR